MPISSDDASDGNDDHSPVLFPANFSSTEKDIETTVISLVCVIRQQFPKPASDAEQ
jgi:hypothetical protein